MKQNKNTPNPLTQAHVSKLNVLKVLSKGRENS